MKKAFIGFSIGFAAVSVLLIIFLASGLWKQSFNTDAGEDAGTRIIRPVEAGAFSAADPSGRMSPDENLGTKIPMREGERVIAVLNKESEEGLAEEQFALYRNSSGAASPVFITFFSYDESAKGYRRMWDAPTAAVRPETISLYSQDLIGDRNNCVIVTGMNAANEHTMTIFRRSPSQRPEQPYRKIAELQIAGSIVVQETNRSYAYQQGITMGQSYNIAAYGQDSASSNILDQIETIYSFNASSGQYEQTRVSRIPGSQLEQRRLRELLSGVPGVFENFINDLWYYVSPQGTIDARQYIYFNPSGREIIFFGDEAQQVFHWQNSTPTRYGLYIRSQNISISTLLRFIDIELESVDSIRLRVIEDVRLKITVSTTWDGSYRRASSTSKREYISQIRPAVNALYDSAWGRLQFHDNGEYAINSSGTTKRGRYVFYNVDGNNLLELRPEVSEDADSRMVYKTESTAGTIILSRVRLGTSGIHDMLEPPVTLTLVRN